MALSDAASSQGYRTMTKRRDACTRWTVGIDVPVRKANALLPQHVRSKVAPVAIRLIRDKMNRRPLGDRQKRGRQRVFLLRKPAAPDRDAHSPARRLVAWQDRGVPEPFRQTKSSPCCLAAATARSGRWARWESRLR
jgi:hypothetical protein